jgi:hypothetical protein
VTIALLESLARLGVHVTARDDRLHIDAPAGVLTASHKAALAQHKTAILAHLQADATLAEVLGLVERAKTIRPFIFLDDLARLSRASHERVEYGLLADAVLTATRVLTDLQSRLALVKPPARAGDADPHAALREALKANQCSGVTARDSVPELH